MWCVGKAWIILEDSYSWGCKYSEFVAVFFSLCKVFIAIYLFFLKKIQLTITTVDRRKMQLIFKASIIDMDGKTLLDFRLSKGCGLEFKRTFLKIRSSLGDSVLKGPVLWPIAIATNSVP